MSASTPIAEVLAALAAILGRLQLRWYLFGAQAVLLWGRPRTSLDIDVTVELEPEAAPELIDRLDEAGFELPIRSGVDAFVRRAEGVYGEAGDTGARGEGPGQPAGT